MHLKGRAASGVVFVANAALSVASTTGDMPAVSKIISDLSSVGAKMNSESIKHIVRALGNVGDCEMILALLICLRGQDFANDLIKEVIDGFGPIATSPGIIVSKGIKECYIIIQTAHVVHL